jgi:hypothetical protein
MKKADGKFSVRFYYGLFLMLIWHDLPSKSNCRIVLFSYGLVPSVNVTSTS